MDNPTTTPNENIIPEFKKTNVMYPIMFMLLLLLVVMFCILFKVKLPGKEPTKSQEEVIADVFIILFFCLLVFGICIALLPNFKDIKKLFEQISSVTYVIIYTIFLILFFTLVPTDTINKYSLIITITTMILGSVMFYKSLNNNYITEFNVNYERIKTMILFFCLITIFIIYYNTDPGGYIEKYFGYSLLLTIIISVFAFLYLVIVLTLSDNKNPKATNILDNFSKVSSYGSIAFLVFIAIMTILISTYPGGFFNDKATSAAVMIILLIICILSAIILGANTFPEIFNNSPLNDKMNLFKRSLLALFGIVISSLLIFWLVYNIQNLSGKTGTTSFILNILLVVVVLGLIYKTINVKTPGGNSNKNAFFSLITNILFYIPCLFSGLFDFIGKSTVSDKNSSETAGSLLMLVVALLLIVGYFKTPSVFNILNKQGGEQLVNKPVYTDSKYSLGSYEELNGSDKPDYQYAISAWVFVDAAPPSTSSSYNKFTSLLNFANKPNVLYNGTTNTLMITTEQKNLKDVTKNKLIDFDENGNRIIYKKSNFLLQKWNNIIINYSGGVLDIFLNGELVKSDVGIVPYMTYDNLTIGEDNGIKGGICNVIYFKQALNSSNIYYLYNMVKDRSPPVLNDSNTTITKQDFNEINSSAKSII
jgi:hypothetical protein